MPNQRLVVGLFLVAAVLFLLAALIPVFSGQALNATFLALAVVFFVLGIAKRRKTGAQVPRSTDTEDT